MTDNANYIETLIKHQPEAAKLSPRELREVSKAALKITCALMSQPKFTDYKLAVKIGYTTAIYKHVLNKDIVDVLYDPTKVV